MAKEPVVHAAAGTATRSPADNPGRVERAMTAAAQELFDSGVHDPDKVLAAKLKARESERKAMAAERAEADAARVKADAAGRLPATK